jgi:hypothetical protein
VGEVEEGVEDPTGDEGDEGENGPPEGSFGARVSADARGESDGQPGVDGRQISEEARAMGEARRAAGGDEADDDDDDEGVGAAVSAGARGGARGR